MSKQPKKMGRPTIIKDEEFDEFIKLPLPRYDIAKILRCSDDTLEKYCKARFGQTFTVVQDQNRQIFRGRILAKQYELAMAGNVPLLIWLGKNYVDQVDTRRIEGVEEKPLTLTYKPTEVKSREVKEIKDESIIEVTGKRDSEERGQEIPSEDRGDQRDPQDPSGVTNGSNEG